MTRTSTLSNHPEAVRSRERRARLRASQATIASQQPSPPTSHSNQPRRRRRSRQSNADIPPVNRTFSYVALSRPNAISTPWHATPCPHCGAHLLMAEDSNWCCRGGTKLLPPLPPLPPRILNLIANHSVNLNIVSRRLNYLFCMSAIGVSEKFTEYHGEPLFFVVIVFY